MTRETKVGLLVGMGVILLIGILVSDHLSTANEQNSANLLEFAPDAQDSMQPQQSRPAVAFNPVPQPPLPVQERSPLPQPGQVISLEARRVVDLAPREPQTLIFADIAKQRRAEASGDTTSIVELETVGRSVPQPTIHYVGKSETLYQIANRYYGDGNLWRTIAQANPNGVHPNGGVDVNVRLIIPHITTVQDGSAFVSVTPRERSNGTFGLTANSTPGSERWITVGAGQTLSELAAEHLGSSRNWPQIMEANRDRLSDPRELREGMKIRLPAPAPGIAPGTGRARQATAIPAMRERGQFTAYTVKPGDTLINIARKKLGDGSRWEELYAANRNALPSEDDLTVGQKLQIPAR